MHHLFALELSRLRNKVLYIYIYIWSTCIHSCPDTFGQVWDLLPPSIADDMLQFSAEGAQLAAAALDR